MQFSTTCHQGIRRFELLLRNFLEPTCVGRSDPNLITWTPVLPSPSVVSPGVFPPTSRAPKGWGGGGSFAQCATSPAPSVDTHSACLGSGSPLEWRVKSSEAYDRPLTPLSFLAPDHVATLGSPTLVERILNAGMRPLDWIRPSGR